MNATRFALMEHPRALGLPFSGWSGGWSRWNRDRSGLPKMHALDARCVGDLAEVVPGLVRTALIDVLWRGQYQRTNVDGAGLRGGYRMRQERVRRFQTGDLVRAEIPTQFKVGRVQIGPVAVRASGSFRVGRVDGIGWRNCRLVQRADGHRDPLAEKEGGADPSEESRGLRAAAR
jgi:hypothetical protein